MSAHTPGPWKMSEEPNDPCCWRFHVESDERSKKFQNEALHPVADVLKEEDARLIAAAPELLGALGRVGSLLKGLPYVPPEGQDERLRIIASVIESAIAKARGTK